MAPRDDCPAGKRRFPGRKFRNDPRRAPVLRRYLIAAAAVLAATPGFAMAQDKIGTVNVLYAGSLVNLMERGIGPAFEKVDGGRFRGYAGGSNKLANEIKGKLRQGDVFISANPKVNNDLEGAANGGWVTWYVSFAQSPLVLGYNASSKFAAELKTKPWYKVLEEPGIRIGRTDPKLDPKGKLTVDLLKKASEVYKLPDLSAKVLGAPENPSQVLPEENLVGRLQSGQLDVGFFYSTETTDLKITAIPFPANISLGAHYTITVLHHAPNSAGAEHFAAFLLGPQGRDIMAEHGLDLVKPKISGDARLVPVAVSAVTNAAQ
jgi:molybdate/tungstate transport system substrate-binding protein